MILSQCIVLSVVVAVLWSISISAILEKLLRFLRPTTQWVFIETIQYVLIAALIINHFRMQKIDGLAVIIAMFINLIFLYFPNPKNSATKDVLSGRIIAYPIGLGFFLLSNMFSLDYRNLATDWINQLVIYIFTIPAVAFILSIISFIIMLSFIFNGLLITIGLIGAKVRKGS